MGERKRNTLAVGEFKSTRKVLLYQETMKYSPGRAKKKRGKDFRLANLGKRRRSL